MAYPPTVPPVNRNNNTPQVDNHPGDHNTIGLALNDIITVLGATPGGAQGNLTARLGWLSYDGTTWAAAITGAYTFAIGGTTKLTIGGTTITIAPDLAVTGKATVTGQIVGNGGANIAGATQLASLDVSGAAAVHGVLSIGSPGIDGISIKAPGADGIGISIVAPVLVNNGPWNNRPLVISQYGASAGAGIGFNAASAGIAGVFQFYNNEFTANNAANNGYIPFRASAFNQASHPSLKDNIEPIPGDDTWLHRVHPIKFHRNDDGRDHLGFDATELAELLPDVIDYDEDGTPAGIDLGGVLAALVLAVQHLAEQAA